MYPWLLEHWAFFIRRLEQDRLAHALMVMGPAGTGKLALANAMVAKLLCNKDLEYACGQCRSCQLLAGGAHPDGFDIQPEEGSEVIKVDQVRALIATLNLTTSISTRKTACIHPAENMNLSSANALLKSLEEPVGDTVLILVCNDPARVPVTIRSRCQTIMVNQPEREAAMAWLGETADMPLEKVHLALEAAGGSPLRAMHYLASPELNAFGQVRDALASLLGRPASVSPVSNGLGALKPDDLWRWLSICTAEAIRCVMAGGSINWLPPKPVLQATHLLELQTQADINRKLSTTPVRGDLLLHDWLIRWAEQAV